MAPVFGGEKKVHVTQGYRDVNVADGHPVPQFIDPGFKTSQCLVNGGHLVYGPGFHKVPLAPAEQKRIENTIGVSLRPQCLPLRCIAFREQVPLIMHPVRVFANH